MKLIFKQIYHKGRMRCAVYSLDGSLKSYYDYPTAIFNDIGFCVWSTGSTAIYHSVKEWLDS